jgi:hypothetical protein
MASGGITLVLSNGGSLSLSRRPSESFGVLAFPESPRWLLKHGKEKEATQIMARLKQCDVEDKGLNKEIIEIKKINDITAGTKLTLKEFFSNGDDMNLWRSSIAFAAQAFQQIGGINLVTYCKFEVRSYR